VKNAERYLEDLFLVFNGDVYSNIDLRAMLSLHYERKAKVTIALTPVENPTVYGVVETDPQGRVKRFLEKPKWEEVTTNLINAGTYILDREVLQDIPSHTPFMFEHHLFPRLLEKGVPIYSYPSDAYWIDMGTPEKYLQLHHDLLQGKSASAFHCQNKHKVAPGFLHPTAKIEGAVVIGEGCTIGSGARIKGPTTIGEGCQILDGATIEGAILWRHVQVGQRAILKDCIIGDNSLIGDDSLIPEGSVISDDVVVTKGSHLSPGSKIWPDTKVG
jgi:mannose-1-phosphate guanylyltransferase